MLGYGFAAEAARDRANGRTDDRAYGPRSDGAYRRTGSHATRDTACCRSNADSDGVRTRGARNRIAIRTALLCIIIVHSVLRYR